MALDPQSRYDPRGTRAPNLARGRLSVRLVVAAECDMAAHDSISPPQQHSKGSYSGEYSGAGLVRCCCMNTARRRSCQAKIAASALSVDEPSRFRRSSLLSMRMRSPRSVQSGGAEFAASFRSGGRATFSGFRDQAPRGIEK